MGWSSERFGREREGRDRIASRVQCTSLRPEGQDTGMDGDKIQFENKTDFASPRRTYSAARAHFFLFPGRSKLLHGIVPQTHSLRVKVASHVAELEPRRLGRHGCGVCGDGTTGVPHDLTRDGRAVELSGVSCVYLTFLLVMPPC